MNSSDCPDISTSQRTQNLVLITDDDRSLQMLLKVAMEQEGFEVAQSNSGEQCLRDYQRLQPDMVLLDAVMPGIDGFECCRQLRQLPGADQVPILMITVLDDSESVAQAFDAGATDYITKPIYWAVLSHRVRRLLESYQTTLQSCHVAQNLRRYQQWCSLQHQLLQSLQTLPLDGFLQATLHALQISLAGDRSCVALYHVRQEQWRIAELTPNTIATSLTANLTANFKIESLSDACLDWLKSQSDPITIHKRDAIGSEDPIVSTAVPIFRRLQDSLQDLLSEILGSTIQVVPIFNQTPHPVTLHALLICSKIESEHGSDLEIAMVKSIGEMIAIAFQRDHRATD